jgi:1-pyrroline-5-carboxylate dehydrogenase
VEYRPLEGYVVAITPFNFSAIGINLPTAPAIMGNVVLWKPASTAIYSNWLMYQILRESVLPDGVIQWVPGRGSTIGDALIDHPYFAGVHFTGSTPVFNHLWSKTAENNTDLYRSYPRLVGETGGKNYHWVHPSYVDVTTLTAATIRAAFEYQGQKCSALSRMYVPESLWPAFRARLLQEIPKIKVGQADDPTVFMTAVIDEASFDNITGYIDRAKVDPAVEVLIGGKSDKTRGWFVEPTVLVTNDPHSETMHDEIFGPVLTVYVYPDEEWRESLDLLDSTSSYGLTGGIFSSDTFAIHYATSRLRNSAGNFYINDKCTGSVVGQQPFGGARKSGNNQKAGATDNLRNWTSPRAIKESFLPLESWTYPHMK